jgi:F-type H+-transporting ATPase subunit alpha
MFFKHSSLLERAGRLDSNGKCLTAIPVVHTPNGDITAYLPTNIMSITDGQWILDMETFRAGIRPAVSIGLSVTRTGGVGHTKRQKDLAAKALKTLADYRQAEEFSHFGAELAAESRQALATGKRIFEIITQSPTETFSLMSQQLMFDIVLGLQPGEDLNVPVLKTNVAAYAAKVTKEEDFGRVRDELKAKCLIKLKPAAVAKPAAPAAAPPHTEAKAETKDKKHKDAAGAKK